MNIPDKQIVLNNASELVLRSVLPSEVGLLKEVAFIDGQYFDEFLYQILF